MDRMLYVAMSGAKQNMQAQAINTNNLANVNTTGFRADLVDAESRQLYGPGHASRVNSIIDDTSTDFTHGTIATTGRNLDIAINGKGWFVVQTQNGQEAITRNGNFKISPEGLLVNNQNLLVMGESGPISIPQAQKVEINGNGTVSVVPVGEPATSVVVLDRLKLVNPDNRDIIKGKDGLVRLKQEGELTSDASISIVSGALENSNVNAIEAMVNMIELQRQFEMQIKLMRKAEQNDEQTSQMLKLN
ncbi:Flagellar basal-body rod protein FlgF [hydrothermal vent metagenome]|uniref:Flagellar basal-body rod protein FlgF n=1 Tax=hydrothermal vent metagenome TaxID=652676 RepID=A0A3B1A312_9ZZZZ